MLDFLYTSQDQTGTFGLVWMKMKLECYLTDGIFLRLEHSAVSYVISIGN